MKRQPDHRTVTMLRTIARTGNANRRAQALRELERLGVGPEPGGPLTRMMAAGEQQDHANDCRATQNADQPASMTGEE